MNTQLNWLLGWTRLNQNFAPSVRLVDIEVLRGNPKTAGPNVRHVKDTTQDQKFVQVYKINSTIYAQEITYLMQQNL